MNKKKKSTLILLTLILLQFTPPFRLLQSLSIMSVYSKLNEKQSIMANEEFSIFIPGGLETNDTDWYPFVMTFNDDIGFRGFTGNQNLRLTIMYNFPAFSLKNGCSRIFDLSSPYYSSFYGAYIVQDESEKPFGFIDNNGLLDLDMQSVSEVPQFDLQNLVLSDFGLNKDDMVFEWNIQKYTNETSYLGYDNWSLIDAELTVNGASHNKSGFVQSYIQYGSPSYDVEYEFKPVQMKGRVYSRYFEEYNCSIFFYIITTDTATLEKCDKEILSKSLIVRNADN